MKKKETNPKLLSLEVLAKYNKEILLPEMEKRFVTKKEFSVVKTDIAGLNIDTGDIKRDVKDLKTAFYDFKNEDLTNQDVMLKKLDILLTEKTVGEYQEKKAKKLWTVIIKALKEHRILSPKDLQTIAQLEIF